MNDSQTNILNMSHAVDQALARITVANPIPALVTQYDALKAKIAEVKAHAAVQAQPVTGTTLDRKRAFETAIDAALVVADLVRSHARTQKLGELEAKVLLTRSSFTQLRLAHRVPLMQQVHDAALSVLPQLAGVGVTAETLTDLQTKIDAADAIKTQSRSTVVVRHTATKTLRVLFRELTDLLDHHLDPQMNALRKTKPQDWEDYQGARKIIALSVLSDKPEEEVTTTTTARAEKLAA